MQKIIMVRERRSRNNYTCYKKFARIWHRSTEKFKIRYKIYNHLDYILFDI